MLTVDEECCLSSATSMPSLMTSSGEIKPSYVKTDLVNLIHRAQEKCTEALRIMSSGSASPAFMSDDLFSYHRDLVKIQAPMVRCSRPPFRKLCRLWGTDVNYTHMIMSESFTRSAEARASDFSLYEGEDRLVVQLAGTSGPTMAAAAAMVSPFCDAIDINCGCPQKWAMREGIGSALLEKPELVADMVQCIRNAVPGELIPCVVKMRVYDDTAKSVDFARQVAAAGASWVTVHGRTPWDTPSALVRTDVVTLIRDSVTVPVVANGSVESPKTAMGLALSCGVGAVMSGRGLLSCPSAYYQPPHDVKVLLRSTDDASVNPAEATITYRVDFSDVRPMYDQPPTNPASAVLAQHPLIPPHLSSSVMCPLEVISDFTRLAAYCGLPFKATQHHLLLMAHDYLSPAERQFISQQRSCVGLVRSLAAVGLYTTNGRASFPN